ncbi:MAG: hypothetical protein CMJ78_12315 [Planctomycetaceae bacterium]|nr:hypothetical protein [Planctomycetaceae bacterium]
MSEKQIIIADDERALTTVFAMRCKQLGARVKTYANGRRAHEMIKESKPNLVILDIDMPGEDGLSICQGMKASSDPAVSQIPVLIVSGRNDERTIQRCQQLDATYCQKSSNIWSHIKPFILDTLQLEEPKREVIGRAQRSKPAISMLGKVLCIDDDLAITRAIQLRLRQYGIVSPHKNEKTRHNKSWRVRIRGNPLRF